jgi:hypothetical protein
MINRYKIAYFLSFLFAFGCLMYSINQEAEACNCPEGGLIVALYLMYWFPCIVLLLIAVFLRLSSKRWLLITSFILSIICFILWPIINICMMTGTQISYTSSPLIAIIIFELLNAATVYLFWKSNKIRFAAMQLAINNSN